MRGPGSRVAAALSAAALLAFGSTAVAATTTGASSATKCAGGHSIATKLGPGDLKLITSFIVCLGKQWQLTSHDGGNGAGGFDSLGGIPGVTTVLDSFAKDPKSDNSTAFMTSHLYAAKDPQSGAASLGAYGCFSYALGDTTPQSPSLTTLAGFVDRAHGNLVKAIGVQGNFLRSTALVQRGAWFHDGSADNVRFAVVFAGSSVTGHADCLR